MSLWIEAQAPVCNASSTGPADPPSPWPLDLPRAAVVPEDREACLKLRRIVMRLQQRLQQTRCALLQARVLAEHDPLTGLLNRRAWDVLAQSLLTQGQWPPRMTACLVIDLDGFKPLNDRHGHHVGDLALRVVAQRLRGAVRREDPIYRIGGDEFACVLTCLPSEACARDIAQQVARTLCEPFEVGHQMLAISASVGLSVQVEGLVDLSALAREADNAMYAAKASGGGLALAICHPKSLPGGAHVG